MKQSKPVVAEYGTGDNVIVLLHGYMASSSYWRRLQPYLVKAGYRVVVVDLLGFGRAAQHHAEYYDYGEHINHIHTTIAQLDLPKRLVLVGHSMGAMLAARYATLYPSQILRLYLLHPPLYKNKQQVRETLRNTGIGYRYLLDSPRRNIGWAVMSKLPLVPIAKHAPLAREKSMTAIIEASEFIADLKTITLPTKLLVGLRDRKEYQANLQNIELNDAVSVIIEDVAHHSPVRQPKRIAQIITDFQ